MCVSAHLSPGWAVSHRSERWGDVPLTVISTHFPPFILQMKKLRPRKVKGGTEGHGIPS